MLEGGRGSFIVFILLAGYVNAQGTWEDLFMHSYVEL